MMYSNYLIFFTTPRLVLYFLERSNADHAWGQKKESLRGLDSYGVLDYCRKNHKGYSTSRGSFFQNPLLVEWKIGNKFFTDLMRLCGFRGGFFSTTGVIGAGLDSQCNQLSESTLRVLHGK